MLEKPDVDVLVIGAGVTGLYQLYCALRDGFRAVLLEAGHGVGGTWYWNRYPAARLDSESYTYVYLFDEQLFREWTWSELFAAQPELERYFNHVVERFGLGPHVQLGVKVTSLVWDDDRGWWRLSTHDGSTWTAQFVVAATGMLSYPYFPDVEGRDAFLGEAYHTGLWPREPVSVADKRVAVVGTGSSGVQLVPALASEAAELVVYQRTPNWCTPLNNRPLTGEDWADLRSRYEWIRDTLNCSSTGFLTPMPTREAHATFVERLEFYEQMWAAPGFAKLLEHYRDLTYNAELNREWCEFIANKIRSIVRDPAIAERLIPTDHRFGEKRPPFVEGYFEAFNEPHVELVSLLEEPMVRVTPTGIETTLGHREHDVIVWATGFDYGTGQLMRMGVRGREGRRLEDYWADGPQTFLGVQAAGFPNLFFPGGPHGASANVPRYNSDQVDYIAELLVTMRDRGYDVVEVPQTLVDEFTGMVDRLARHALFSERSYFFGGNIPGKPRKYLLNPAGRQSLHERIDALRAEGFSSLRFETIGSSTRVY